MVALSLNTSGADLASRIKSQPRKHHSFENPQWIRATFPIPPRAPLQLSFHIIPKRKEPDRSSNSPDSTKPQAADGHLVTVSSALGPFPLAAPSQPTWQRMFQYLDLGLPAGYLWHMPCSTPASALWLLGLLGPGSSQFPLQLTDLHNPQALAGKMS